jgi:hypothetical protein
MTASLRGHPACNTEACWLSRLKFVPCGQQLAPKTRRRDSCFGPGLRQRSTAAAGDLARLEIEEDPSRNRDT